MEFKDALHSFPSQHSTLLSKIHILSCYYSVANGFLSVRACMLGSRDWSSSLLLVVKDLLTYIDTCAVIDVTVIVQQRQYAISGFIAHR